MLEAAAERCDAELDGNVDRMRTEGVTRYLLGEVEEGTKLLDAAIEGTEWDEYGGFRTVADVARAWLDLGEVERAFAAARRIPPKKRSARGSLMAELVATRLGMLGVPVG